MATGRASWGMEGINVTSVCTQKGGGSEELQVQPHLHPWDSGGANSPGILWQTLKDIKVIRSSQEEFPKGTSCLTKLVGDRRARDGVYLTFARLLTLSHVTYPQINSSNAG